MIIKWPFMFTVGHYMAITLFERSGTDAHFVIPQKERTCGTTRDDFQGGLFPQPPSCDTVVNCGRWAGLIYLLVNSLLINVILKYEESEC